MYRLLVVVAVFLIIVAVTIQPIEKKPLNETSYYQESLHLIAGLAIPQYPAIHQLQAGWNIQNITPEKASLAGYTPRKAYDKVLDSLYCRVITLSNGGVRISLISLDLLITPPAVKKRVEQLLTEKGVDSFPYFSSIHTHNGIGNWDASLAGRIIAGKFQPEIVDMIAHQVVKAITFSINNLQDANLEYFKIPAPDLVLNRLDPTAKKDSYLRGIKINRKDNSVGYLATYAAHPTNLPMKSTYLSAEYPGRLVSALEKEANFALFMAGMVGSHGLTGIEQQNIEKIQQAGERLAEKILTNENWQPIDRSATIQYQEIELPLKESKLRLGGNWQLRDWLFTQGFGNLQASITLVKIGNLVLLSMPGDFSGELYQNHIAGNHDEMEVIITSFNGDFVGYIIDDRHYWTSKKDEANVMNWLGPHGGKYFASITNQILRMLSE